MAKEKTLYVCTHCGQDSPKWVGKCPSCGQWNTYVEQVVRKESPTACHGVAILESTKSQPLTLSDIHGGEEPRINMHDEELNFNVSTGSDYGSGCRELFVSSASG